MPGTVAIGSQGAEVEYLQQLLQYHGYFTGTPGAAFDEETEAGVRAFQQAAGLPSDGIAGPHTWAALTGEQAEPEAHRGYDQADDGAGHAHGAVATTISFGQGEGETISGSADHLGSLRNAVIEAGRQRLSEHQTYIVQAVNDFRSHVHTETENLEGKADFNFAPLISGLTEVVEAFFPVEAVAAEITKAAIKAFVDNFAEGMHEAYAHSLEHDLSDAKAKLRGSADALSQAAGIRARAAWAKAVDALPTAVDGALQERSDLYQNTYEAHGQLCDVMGIPDPQRHSPYSGIRARLEVDFAGEFAKVRNELEHGDTPFWDMIGDDRARDARIHAREQYSQDR